MEFRYLPLFLLGAIAFTTLFGFKNTKRSSKSRVQTVTASVSDSSDIDSFYNGSATVSCGVADTSNETIFLCTQGKNAAVGNLFDSDSNLVVVPASVNFLNNGFPFASDFYNECSGVTFDNSDDAFGSLTTENIQIIDNDGELFTAYVFADNYFEFYVNGQLIAKDPVPYLPLNAAAIQFQVTRPFTLGVLAVDWEEKLGLGIESDDNGNDAITQGGIIVVVEDIEGNTIATTNNDWKVQTYYTAPIADLTCPSELGSLRISGNCVPDDISNEDSLFALHWNLPENWAAAAFDDTNWPNATPFLNQKSAYDNIPAYSNFTDIFDKENTEVIWTSNLSLDNVILGRYTVAMGMDTMGMDTMGMDTMGMDTMGMDTMGMDTMGMDTMGMDTMGMDTMGMDTMGMDTMGMDTMGMDTMGMIDSKGRIFICNSGEQIEIEFSELVAGMDSTFILNQLLFGLNVIDTVVSPIDTTVSFDTIGFSIDTITRIDTTIIIDSMYVDTMDMDTMGMDTMGMDTMGMDTMGMDTMGMDTMGMDTMGMDTMGMDTMGMDTMGMDTMGMDTMGMDTMGMDTMGMDTMGMDTMGMDTMGMDTMGMDTMGMDTMGMDTMGMDTMGMDTMGMDTMGMDTMGMDTMGMDTMGMDTMGMDTMGMDTMGMDTMGMDTMGMDTMGMDTMGMDTMGMDTMGVNGGFTIWDGPTLNFMKPNNADPTDVAFQDSITENVILTRANSGGQIYNIAVEESSDKSTSPQGTEWALGNTSMDISQLSFDNFRNTTKPQDVVGNEMVLYLVEDDVYLDITFNSWERGNDQKGGFSYTRSTAPTEMLNDGVFEFAFAQAADSILVYDTTIVLDTIVTIDTSYQIDTILMIDSTQDTSVIHSVFMRQADFDEGLVILSSNDTLMINDEYAYHVSQTCTESPIYIDSLRDSSGTVIGLDTIQYTLFGDAITVCCEDEGELDIVVRQIFNGDSVDYCNNSILLIDDNVCNPIEGIECDSALHATISIDEHFDSTSNTIQISISDLGIADINNIISDSTNTIDFCMMRKADYDAGPVILSNGNPLIINGRAAYTLTNGCESDGTFVDDVLDSLGNVIGQDTLSYILCNTNLEICCEEVDNQEYVLIQSVDNDILRVCDLNINLEDGGSNITCAFERDTVMCFDMAEDRFVEPMVQNSECSTDAAPSIDHIDELIGGSRATATGLIRTYYIDSNTDGMADSTEVICSQEIVITDQMAFDPLTIKWPRHRNGGFSSGFELLCTNDSLNVMAADSLPMLPGFADCSAAIFDDLPTFCENTCGLTSVQTRIDTLGGQFVREYTIVDWNVYDPEENNDASGFDQVVAVLDHAQGVCSECPDTNGAEQPDSIYFRYAANVEHDGFYQYRQLLSLVDDQAPRINVPDTVIIAALPDPNTADACTGLGDITATAIDSCGSIVLDSTLINWVVTVRNFAGVPIPDADGNIQETFTGNSATVSSREGFLNSTNIIEWRVTDAFGNQSVASTFVLFRDETPPVANCRNSINAVVSDDRTATIIGRDFNVDSRDNCTRVSGLLYTVVPRGQTPLNPLQIGFSGQNQIEVSCDNVLSLRNLDVYVWDRNNNGSKCEVTVNYQIDCDSVQQQEFPVSGFVRTELDEYVPSAEVTINSSAPNYPQVAINDSTGYSFENTPLGNPYMVTVDKDDDTAINGLSTLDILLIQRHILGLSNLESVYKIIAADANTDDKISTIDLILIRRVILESLDTFPDNENWIFIDEDADFVDSLQPFPYDNFESIEFTLEDTTSNVDFIAMKKGDVNNSVSLNTNDMTSIRSNSTVALTTVNKFVDQGQKISVPITIDHPSLLGFQQSFAFDGLELVNVHSSGMEITSDMYHYDDDKLHISWVGKQTQSEAREFTLEFIAQSSGLLSNMIQSNNAHFANEAYVGDNLEIAKLALEFESEMQHETALEILQNQPNPFSTESIIHYSMDDDRTGVLMVFNSEGKIVHQRSITGQKGLNSIRLTADDLQNQNGVYHYNLQFENQMVQNRLILIK